MSPILHQNFCEKVKLPCKSIIKNFRSCSNEGNNGRERIDMDLSEAEITPRA